ncbi:hypothetical protein EJD97_017933 [Solanum chilense]|uniref:Peptidase A1 domain-containing protein n=1 Tax=Solanum chilense TaxID=4083 RepID=A0A6N2B4U6_SOLCI|nr:hypothetical protein EJD97_017933 [Solanum chilense]
MEYLLLITLILMSMFHLNSFASNLINEKSYFKVNSTALKQARKAFMAFDTSNLQDPPMPPKSFSVYHLDLFEKSKFKDYDSVFNNRLSQDNASATYLSSMLKSHNSTKNVLDDQILKVTPTMYLRETKSCFYVHVYDNGETTKGFVASDIITFPSDNTQSRINFGCSVDQKSGHSHFSGTFSGIVGLSKKLSAKTTGGYSLPSQLGSSLFALCLPSLKSTQPSILTFNKAPWIYGTEAKFVKNRLNPHLYYVNLYKIFINDKEVPVDPSWWSGKKDDHGAMVDTGSLITRFPHDLYIVFRYIFREEMKYPMLQYPIGIFDTCYKEEENEDMYFPIIRFYFGSVSHKQELMLVQERVVADLQGFYCLAFLPWDDKTTLIGSHQLQGTGLTFDFKNNALTFSVDACD